MPDCPLARYLSSFPDIPGFFNADAMAMWDFLFHTQEQLGISGDFLEIGVYKGRSAVLGAMYLRPQEWCVLIDQNPMTEAEAMIRSFRAERNRFLQCLSSAARESVGLHFGKCRWVHVDGDHKGFSVTHDLELAADLVSAEGIICLDDFYNYRYPQLTAAVYRYVFGRPEFQIFFAGSNKCYVCHSEFFPRYDGAIRTGMLSWMKEQGLDVQLNRSSYTSDGGHFTMTWRRGGRELAGLDEDCDHIPF